VGKSEVKEGCLLAWYHWIATYLLIIAAFAFWIVPEKSLLYIGICVFIGIIALLLMRFLPPKEDMGPAKPLHPALKRTKKIVSGVVVAVAGLAWVASIVLYIYTLFT
jgi:hypothetical protein